MATKKKELRIGDVDCGTVSAYVMYLERFAGLKEVNPTNVYSFRVTDTGIQGLLTKKVKLSGRLQENISRIDYLLENYKHSDNQLIMINAIREQIQDVLDIVNDHVDRCQELLKVQNRPLFSHSSIDQDETPF